MQIKGSCHIKIPLYSCHVCCQIFKLGDGSHDGNYSVHGMCYKGITQFWQDCVCLKFELEEWHKWECHLGEC
jgi:hypothetical protein